MRVATAAPTSCFQYQRSTVETFLEPPTALKRQKIKLKTGRKWHLFYLQTVLEQIP